MTFDEIISGKGDYWMGKGYKVKKIAPHITLADGATLSVQASEGHYCIPRNNDGPYTAVEVGFPDPKPPRSWRKYADGDSSVYGYVPVALVRRYIKLHGGEKVAGD